MEVFVAFVGDALAPVVLVDGYEWESVSFAVMVEDRGFPGALVGVADQDAGEWGKHGVRGLGLGRCGGEPRPCTASEQDG